MDEFGVKYYYYDTFREIWKAHVEYLRQMEEMKIGGKLASEPRISDKVKNDYRYLIIKCVFVQMFQAAILFYLSYSFDYMDETNPG